MGNLEQICLQLVIEMTYSLAIPPDLVGKMFYIRTNTGIPIRRQIIRAIEKYVEEMKDKSIEKIIPS